LSRLLAEFRAGRKNARQVARVLRGLPFADMRFAKVDHHREMRTGFPEVLWCERKRPEQCARIAKEIVRVSGRLLATRADRAAAEAIRSEIPQAEYYEVARIVRVGRRRGGAAGRATVAVVSAGTSDEAVAEEAVVSAEFFGLRVRRVHDVGVAGVHRLVARLPVLRRARVLIVVAGMEGALPSVVAGLVRAPVIAVPTSVGYGASFGGLAALLGMPNACAPGVAVVNIDNGFGAAAFAASMLRL
jgi:NCAIR mutase (PurE)-related protein